MRFGTPDQFANLRALLIDSEYVEVSVCQRHGQSSLRDVEATPNEDREIGDGLDVLIRLLLHSLPVEQRKASKLLLPALLEITRCVVEGFAGPLCPGGRLYCSAMLSARSGAPPEYGLRLISLGQTAPAHIRQLQGRYEHLEIERIVTCSFFAHRRVWSCGKESGMPDTYNAPLCVRTPERARHVNVRVTL
jgi:hypothetical protein